ncbi:MAG: 50S ribosomal protein L32 [Bacteriovoracaceae bacterium]|nr:50S ribosomal protein L32 [Bacteriovoracaceae bacterium]
MAVPKKKTSVSRKGKRRGGQHHKLSQKGNILVDPTTGELTLRHCVTPSGTYKGTKVFETKADREEVEDEA